MDAAALARFIYLLSIVVWQGMLIFFSFFAAPAIFRVLPREKAGEVVGEIFPKYWIIGCISSVLALVTLPVYSPVAGVAAIRFVLLIVMTALTFYSALGVGKKARAIKGEIRAAESPERREALRKDFRKVHMLSSAINMVIIFLGLVLVFYTSEALGP